MERLIYFIKHPLPSLPSSQVSPVDEHRFKRKDLEAGNQNDEKKLEESGSNNKSITSTSSFVKKESKKNKDLSPTEEIGRAHV